MLHSKQEKAEPLAGLKLAHRLSRPGITAQCPTKLLRRPTASKAKPCSNCGRDAFSLLLAALLPFRALLHVAQTREYVPCLLSATRIMRQDDHDPSLLLLCVRC